MKHSRLSILTLVVFAMTTSAGLFAQFPHVVNYRGRLVDASGSPVVDGANFIRFIIYGSEDGPDELWNSGIQQVPTVGGLFSYQLGSNTALPASLFDGVLDLYLGITVGADPEIRPRSRFTSSAFAYHAGRADTATTAQNAVLLDGEPASSYLNSDWNSLTNVPPGFADGVDNDAGGDITEVNVGQAMIGGGDSGPVEVGIASGGITSDLIADGGIQLQDLGQNGAAPGQALTWSGMGWFPADVGDGDITTVAAGAGLTGGGVTGSVTLSLAAGGVNSANIADDAVSPAKILAEPGVAQGTNFDVVTLIGGGSQVLGSQAIDVPAGGYVLVMASCDVRVDHANGATSWSQFGVSANASTVTQDQAKRFQIASQAPTGAFWNVVSAQKVFSVSSAGLRTFYFLGFKVQGTNDPVVDNVTLTLVYFPTAYGTLSTGP